MAMVHPNVRRLVLQSLDSQTPECGICLEPFAHADATVMECCHVTCKGCFNQLRKRECPFCRHKFAAKARAPRETNREINALRRDVAVLNDEMIDLERENMILEQRLRNVRPRGASPQPVSYIGRDPVYVPTDPTYSPATPRFSPDPPPAEWEPRATTPVAPQPPTRTAARVLFPDVSDDEEIVTNMDPLFFDLMGNVTDSESDSDVEVREVVQQAETAPPAPPAPPARRRRGPCRCTLCNQIGHQRNNRRFHPVNTLTN